MYNMYIFIKNVRFKYSEIICIFKDVRRTFCVIQVYFEEKYIIPIKKEKIKENSLDLS